MRRALIGVAVLVALWAGAVAIGRLGIGPVVITPEDEQKIILRLGNPRIVTEPGWTLRVPLIETTRVYDRRLLYFNTEPLPIQTMDQERIVVDNYVVWRIEEPVAFFSSFRQGRGQAEERIDRVVRANVREVIGQRTLTGVVTGERTTIMEEIGRKTAEALREYGIHLEDVRINRTELPRSTEQNVYARMKTERERLARKYRAEGEEKARRIRAEADREATVIVANSRRDSEVTRGRGDAEAAAIYAEAYERSPDFYDFTRSLEAYRKTIGDRTTLVLSPKAEFFRFFEGASPSGSADRAGPETPSE